MFYNNDYKLIFLAKNEAFQNLVNICKQQLKNTNEENNFICDVINQMNDNVQNNNKQFIISSFKEYDMVVNDLFSFFNVSLKNNSLNFTLIIKHIKVKKKYYYALFKDRENVVLVNKVPFDQIIQNDMNFYPQTNYILDKIAEEFSTDDMFDNSLKYFVNRTIRSANKKLNNSNTSLNLFD